jgi:hypothetical protein
MREAAKLDVAEGGGTREPVIGRGGRTVYADQSNLRPEARLEDPAHNAAGRRELAPATDSGRLALPAQARPDGNESVREEPRRDSDRRSLPGPTRGRGSSPAWAEPDVAEQPASYAIYRPETGSTSNEPSTPRVRSEAR